jgi:hypothetical protein
MPVIRSGYEICLRQHVAVEGASCSSSAMPRPLQAALLRHRLLFAEPSLCFASLDAAGESAEAFRRRRCLRLPL